MNNIQVQVKHAFQQEAPIMVLWHKLFDIKWKSLKTKDEKVTYNKKNFLIFIDDVLLWENKEITINFIPS